MNRPDRSAARRAATLASLAALACLAAPAVAEQLRNAHGDLEGIRIVERHGEKVPLDIDLVRSDGEKMKLAELFGQDRPVVVTMVYYNCPMLCGMLLNGFSAGMQKMPELAGREFDIVTVSINAREGPELAAAKKQNHLDALGRPEAAAGWHFFTAERDAIAALSDAVGFRFRYDPDTLQYIHDSAVFVVDSDGIVRRTLHGTQFPPEQIRLALREAGGSVGSAVERALFNLYEYDPVARIYAVRPGRVVALAGVLAVIPALLLALVYAWLTRRRDGATPDV